MVVVYHSEVLVLLLGMSLSRNHGDRKWELIEGRTNQSLPVFQTSAVLRVSSLPLVSSALQSMTSVYSEVKGRYPLLSLMGGVAEVGMRSVSQVAMTRATPLLQSLEPQSMCV